MFLSRAIFLGRRQAPFLFTKIDKELLRLVTTPMGTSMAYNPNAAAKAAKPKGKSKRKEDNKENNNPKRRKRAEASEPDQLHVPQETMSTEVAGAAIQLPPLVQETAVDSGAAAGPDDDGVAGCEADDEEAAHQLCSMLGTYVFMEPAALGTNDDNIAKKREKTFLDDLLHLFSHVAHSQKAWLAKPMYQKPVMQIRSIVLSIGLEFCFAGRATVSGKVYKTWSALRGELRELVVSCLAGMRTSCDAIPAGEEAKSSAAASVAACAAVSQAVHAKGVAGAAAAVQGRSCNELQPACHPKPLSPSALKNPMPMLSQC